MYTGPKPGSPSDDGYFNFCAPPGTYFVEVIMPPLGLVRARADIGTNEEIDSDIDADGRTNHFTVSSGQSKNDLGAGFYPMAVAGNLVWRDDNLNGIQDVGEAKVQGVIVEAIELNTGSVAASAVTDSDGIYTLDYLEKQVYYLKFTPPAEYTATIPGAGSDNMDSDVDHSFGINTTRAFNMEPSNENNNIDMGIAFGVLPVEWLNIFAKKSKKGNFIHWTVGREWNVSHYIIERKASGEQQFFELPEKVSVKENKFGYSEYTFDDLDKLSPGICYYKVKQVDFDGKFSYSEIVYVNESNSFSVNLYPNPSKSLTNLEILQDKDGMIEVDLLDSNGKFVKRLLADYEIRKGENLIPINLQEIPKGLYMVRISDGSGSAIDRKLLLTD
ncbi:MAG: T9SS type A sorting domain-containing protein [Saprospiraceae bacterium]|nr:T9SS type A sorting domain-containing protein [Saprospiraceae bacterium]